MQQNHQKETGSILAGIDVGSTTTKIAVLEAETGRVLFSDYERHHADQAGSVERAVSLLAEKFPGISVRAALTGSGAKNLSEEL